MYPNAVQIDYIRTLISLLMLGYASYKDIKTREIHDMVWFIPSAAGVLINIYELYIGNITRQNIFFNIGFMVILSSILWIMGLFGDADLLAFVAISVIQPRTPLYDFIGFTPIFFSFTIIANSSMVGLLMAFYTFGVNILENLSGTYIFERHSNTSFYKKILVMFTGRYKLLNSLKGPPFEYPLEVEGELIIKPDIFNDAEANKAFMSLRELGFEKVWISSTLPYIVILMVGYILSVLYGDIMFSIFSILL